MADLLTHFVSARLPGGFVGDPCARTTLVLGVFLPDLVSKSMEAVPWMPYLSWAPSHSVLGVACTSMIAAMLFAEDFRFKAFSTIFFGQLLHLALDIGKQSLGAGTCFLLHPFLLDAYDLGLYSTQDVFWFLPGNILALLVIRWLSKKAQKAGWVWS